MLILFGIPKWISNYAQMFLLWLDSIVYFFVSIIYQLFIYLSTARIFEDAFYANFANRIYAILGVFMLFYLAYALLNALVDPEKLAKGDKSVAKLAQNLIISLIMLGFLPSIFTYAYRLQNYVLSSNLIGAIIMGTKPVDINDDDQVMVKFGDTLSFTVLNAFINPTNENVNMSTNYNWYDFKKDVLENSEYGSLPNLSDAIVYGATVAGSGSSTLVPVTYYAFISTAVGCYLIYILLSFTLDLGVRIIKLAFCQVIAPIPIIMRVMPSKKGTFDKWLKLTLSVYFEVFVRIGIMYMSVYFVKSLAENNIIANFTKDGVMGMFALVVVILGIFTFAKQAPKLISETLGIDSANLKLGIGEKLKAGGFFAGGAMIGAGLTGLTRNAISGFGKIGKNLGKDGSEIKSAFQANNWKGFGKGIAKGLWHTGSGLIMGTASTIAGGSSGIYNAYKPGKDAKGFGDMKKAAGAGVETSTANREKRAAYVASHGGLLGSFEGKIDDMGSSMSQWAGITIGIDSVKNIQSKISEVKSANKAVDDRLEAILNKNKNKYKSLKQYSVAGVGTFDNYADLLNEMEIMKSTGKTSNGTQVKASMLTEMARQEFSMKKDMKESILKGIDLDMSSATHGQVYNASQFNKDYDSELKELITAARTKSLHNAKTIEEMASKDNPEEIAALKSFLEHSVDDQNMDLSQFVLNGNASTLFGKETKEAVNSANSNATTKLNSMIEQEAKKNSK